MTQYRLNKIYPRSPKKGTIITYEPDRLLYSYIQNNTKFYIAPSEVNDYDFWVPYKPVVCNLPFDSWIVDSNHKHYAFIPFKFTEILTYLDGRAPICRFENNSGKRVHLNLETTNNIIKENNNTISYFETEEEALEHCLLEAPVLNLKDIGKIYTTATNKDYEQNKQLIELIKSKLYEIK